MNNAVLVTVVAAIEAREAIAVLSVTAAAGAVDWYKVKRRRDAF